jgi:hypothetical protein
MSIKTGKFASLLGMAMLSAGIVQASDEFVGTGGDWAVGANWSSGEYPTAEEGYLNTTAYLSTSVPTNMWAFRMAKTGDATLDILPGGAYEATQHTAWGSWMGMVAGYTATINQSGGSLTVYELEVGSQDGSFGYYNLSNGTVTVTGTLYDRSLYVGATKNSYKNSALGGTGTFSMTGGTLLTRGGVQMGHSSLSGEGTFEVWGTGPDEIGIGSYTTNNYTGFWEQYSNSTLRVSISADGITPIHLNGGAETNATALFADGSILDVSFMDGYSETGSWPIMVCEGEMVNGGMVLADGVDENWGFMVSNNTLMVGYGLGWPAGNATTIVLPPSPGRTLYWTGNGGDTSSSNAANWAVDTAGTPATWGIYSKDTIYIGHSSLVETGEVSVVDYDGDADYSDQNLLYIGNDRTGVFNINSGTLTFTQSSTSRQQVGIGTEGDGTLNVNGASVSLNTLRIGVTGSKGAVNVNEGSLGVARSSETLDGIATSISVGYSGVGTGEFTISGGSLSTRGGVLVGRSGGASSFCVEGSEASLIEIGKEDNSVDGAWVQYATGTLEVLLDENGVTPILVRDSTNNVHANGGDVYFKAGSLLNVGWVDGVEKYGVFDVMTWDGELVEADLAFDPSVDTNVWDFMFVDTDDNGSNDTLRVVAPKGTTANGTPIWWLYSEGLTDADDETDTDGDGLLAWEEYVAGTSPTNAASVLTINSVNISSDQYVVNWQSVEGKTYSVHAGSTVSLMSEDAAGIAGMETETSYTGTVTSADAQFYRIEVQ